MMHVDPVCGMTIAEEEAVGTFTHDGATYYFCAESCLERFTADPLAFLEPDSQASTLPRAADEAVEYVCPMDPEVRSNVPGPCPICGMALEPRRIALDEGPNPELVGMTRRFWIAAALSTPIFSLSMADMASGGQLTMTHPALLNWLGILLGTPVVFWTGWPFFERAWISDRKSVV